MMRLCVLIFLLLSPVECGSMADGRQLKSKKSPNEPKGSKEPKDSKTPKSAKETKSTKNPVRRSHCSSLRRCRAM